MRRTSEKPVFESFVEPFVAAAAFLDTVVALSGIDSGRGMPKRAARALSLLSSSSSGDSGVALKGVFTGAVELSAD